MTPAVSVTGLTRRYPDQVALDDVHLTIGTETITGLLGRNGAGKTTLLRILAGQEFPSSGSVRVFGSSPAENENVLRRLVLVREDQAYPDWAYPDFKVCHALRAASFCYPNWDAGLASSLLEDFGLLPGKAIKSLSRGQRSALGITIGLAARAEVSMSLVSGLVIAGLQAIERATGGWGLSITFFRVPYLLNGPWYATWLTSFAGLSLLFVYGMWYGIVYRRWGTLGVLAFIAVQVLVALAVTFAYSWSGVGGHLTSLSALDLTGVIAALTVVFLAGGHATIRRVTV
jgi:hypothetical protein